MSGLSRSEQRQLEAVMKASKAEAGIKDSSSDEDTPMSKKVNTGDSARKKPAGKTVGGKTVGGKTVGGKTVGGKTVGGKTVGGKTVGGKTVGGKTVGGKSLGGKTLPKKRAKQASSSEDSSSDSDGDSSSSSSEEEQPRAMPLKKRARAAAAPAPDSGSSDFQDDFDDDLFTGAEDRAWMLSLNELERESIIEERRLKREIAKEAWLLQHKKKRDAARAAAAGGRGRARVAKPDDKKAQKAAALEELAAKKAGASEKARRARAVEDEDAAPSGRKDEEGGAREKTAKPRHRLIDDWSQDFPRLEVERMEQVRVGRDLLVEYAREPFFAEFAIGLFCRINIGTSDAGDTKYLLCQIMGVRDKDEREFQVVDPRSGQKLTLTKHLYVTHAGQRRKFPISLISNKPFQRSEVVQWCRAMFKAKDSLPDRERLEELGKQLRRRWKAEFTYDKEMVDAMLEERRRTTGKIGGNLILSKISLQDEKEVLWEEYQECQDRAERQEAYERWEKVRLQLEELEREEEALKEKGLKRAITGSINSRNFESNRTIKTTVRQSTNITTCRPYVRKEYFAFGQDDSQKAGGGVARKAPGAKQAPDQAKEAKLLGDAKRSKGLEELQAQSIAVDDDEIEVIVGSGSGSGSGSGKGPDGDAPSVGLRATHDALKRAHATEIQVDVDAAKEASKRTEDVLFIRAANPLKPHGATRPQATGRVALSLEEYKRRRQERDASLA